MAKKEKITIILLVIIAWAQLSIAVLGLSGLWRALGIDAVMNLVWGGVLMLLLLITAIYFSIKVLSL